MSATIAKTPETFRVELSNGDSWVRLSIHVGEQFSGGHIIRFTPDVKFGVDGSDALSITYDEKNWLSGAESGAFYAFRALKASRRVIYLSELAGRLHSADMEAVAAAAACAVAGCLDAMLPLDLEGWELKILSPETSQNGKEPAASTGPLSAPSAFAK